MRYQQTTQVPNEVFDHILPSLTGAEYKILMIIIRQTFGWRKDRDRMNYYQFIQKTGLSRRVIADSIQSLCDKRHIKITDYYGNSLNTPEERKGKVSIYFSARLETSVENSSKLGRNSQNPMQKPSYNKTNFSKLTKQNTILNQGKQKISDADRIQQILSDQNSQNK